MEREGTKEWEWSNCVICMYEYDIMNSAIMYNYNILRQNNENKLNFGISMEKS